MADGEQGAHRAAYTTYKGISRGDGLGGGNAFAWAYFGDEMPKIFAMLVSLQIGAVVPALAMDKITYLVCKAENEGAASVVGLDDTTQKVCDRSVEAFWFAPPAFGPAKVIWNDGLYTKAIYRTGSDKRYEQNFLLLVHRGHCHKVEPTTSQSCNLQ